METTVTYKDSAPFFSKGLCALHSEGGQIQAFFFSLQNTVLY